MTTLITKKRFCNDRKKTASRAWFIEKYRGLYKCTAIHPDRQYWTLSGNLCDESGKVGDNSEIDQLLRERFIQPGQYHGVEINETVHERNQRAAPHLKLYLGDIVDVLSNAYQDGTLRPALVNLDTPWEGKKAAELLGRTLDVLNLVDGPTMVILNVVRQFMYRRSSSAEILRALLDDPMVTWAYRRGGWQQSDLDMAEYDGTGHTSAKMTSVLLHREGMACPNLV